MHDPVIEITRRDLIGSLVGLSAAFVLPVAANAQQRMSIGVGEGAVAEGMRNRFGRIVVQVGNLELNHHAKTIGMAEMGMVESYKQNPRIVGDCLSAWVSDVGLEDISLIKGFKNDPDREYINVSSLSAFEAMEEIVAQYNTKFLPLVTGLSYRLAVTGRYPEKLFVGTQTYEIYDETAEIWSYFGGEDRTDVAPRLDVKGTEFSYYSNGLLRMAVDVPVQHMSELMAVASKMGEQSRGAKDIDHLMVLVSGGPDSATTVAEARRMLPEARITPLYLQFGHDQDRGELKAVAALVEKYRLETPEVVDMRGVREVLSGRVLIHSGAAIMPFGNAFVLTFALAYASRARIEEIWVGMHADDVRESHEYSREYFDRIQRLAYATSPEFAPRIVTPFIEFDKVKLFRHGAKLGVDYGSTWSCIRGTDRHCGKCGACLARQRAFSLAGIPDTTVYAETLPFTAQAS